MTKTRTGSYYRLSDNARNVIRMIADERKISQARAIEWLTDEYIRNKKEKKSETMKLLHELKEDVNRVRVTSNVIDRNVQTGLKFWNDYMEQSEFNHSTIVQKYNEEEFRKAFQFGVHQFLKYLNAKKGESYE